MYSSIFEIMKEKTFRGLVLFFCSLRAKEISTTGIIILESGLYSEKIKEYKLPSSVLKRISISKFTAIWLYNLLLYIPYS